MMKASIDHYGMLLRFTGNVCLGALLLLPRAALAQAPAAEALFEQGRQALAAGDYETACARFRASDAIEPGAGVRANIGTCEEKRGRVASAWVAFKDALKKLPPADERRAKIEARIAALEPRVPHLVLTLEPGSPSATTATDEGGAVLGTTGTWGVPLPFDPGPHRLAVAAPGFPPANLEVVLVEGRTATLVVRPGRAGASADSEVGSSVGPWVVGGIGIVGLVVGGVLGGLVLAKKSDATAGCNDATRTCTPAGRSAAQAGATLGPASTVSFVLGGVALAGGGLWLGLSRSGEKKVGTGISIGPVAGGGAVRVGGTW